MFWVTPFNKKKGTSLSEDSLGNCCYEGAYVRAAGRLAAASRIVVSTLLGTCSKLNGSIEYEARPLDSERIAVE